MENYLILWALCAVVCLAIAPMKGRSSLSWAGLGFLFGPAAVLAILVIPASKERENALAVEKGELTLCPYCKEAVKPDAVKCKHCQSDLNEEVVLVATNEREAHRQLQDAIYQGDARKVKAILASGLDVSNCPLPFGHADYASIHGNQEILDLIQSR